MNIIDQRQKYTSERTGGWYNVKSGRIERGEYRAHDRLRLPDGSYRIVRSGKELFLGARSLDRPIPSSPENHDWEEIGYTGSQDVQTGDFIRVVFWGARLEGFVLGLDQACGGDPDCIGIGFEPDGLPVATVYLDNCAGIRLWRHVDDGESAL